MRFNGISKQSFQIFPLSLKLAMYFNLILLVKQTLPFFNYILPLMAKSNSLPTSYKTCNDCNHINYIP